MPEDGALCPVVFEDVLIGYEAYGALRGLGECGILERAEGIGWEKASQGSIRLGAREEESLLAGNCLAASVSQKLARIDARAHQAFAPPCGGDILRLEGPVFIAAPHQLIEGGTFQGLCHKHGRANQQNGCKQKMFHTHIYIF